jgi:hypothetical protein
MKRTLFSLCVLLAAIPAEAQSEAALREYFEGRSVVLKLDMPATSQGVDVAVDARRPVDFDAYGVRLKTTGTAIKSGESVMVTKVRVKEKLIEFHLAGGGFGTFGDDTSTSVYVPSASKSNREKNLERDVKAERDAARRRKLQEELDDLKQARAREDQRNEASSAAAEEEKKQRIASQRLHGGSRFNIRYPGRVPTDVKPEDIVAALEQFVEFPFVDGPRTRAAAPIAPAALSAASPAARTSAPPSAGTIRKGMSFQDAEALLGKSERATDRMEGKLKVTTAIFSRDDQRIEAEFVEGVLIRYSISSK